MKSADDVATMAKWRDDFDRRIEDLCSRAEYLVEADDFARAELWSRWHDHRGLPWEQVSVWLQEQVGTLDEMPVCVHAGFAIIEHFVVAFWSMPSMVTDSRMAEPWLEKMFPKVSRGRRGQGSRTADAFNFHNIVHDIEERTRRTLTKRDKNMYVPCPHCGRKGV